MASTKFGVKSVIIVGAGPSGLLLALSLASLDPRPKVTIFDAAATLDRAPRATHYGASAIQFFRKVGILEEIRRDGYVPDNTCWRKLDGTRLAGMDWTGPEQRKLDGDAVTVYPVGRMCELLERELEARAGIRVQWGSRVTAIKSGLESDDPVATVVVEEDGQTREYSADYVVGTDGGNSTVRRLVFGKGNFPGHSWDQQIVATNTEYDFDQFGWEDANFIIHPEHFYMAARIIPHPDPKRSVWRISYGELSGLSNEELIDRQPMKFEKMLPGFPKPDQYRVLSMSPYRVHQRCVDSMRVNRVLLAADAAHLCNPFGGLGLTGGVADIAGLSQCFEGMHKGLVDDSILDTWSSVQRQKWHDVINPVSSSNIKRLFDQDPEKVLEQDDFLMLLKKIESDPSLGDEMAKSKNDLNHDYTQYFSNQANGDTSNGV